MTFNLRKVARRALYTLAFAGAGFGAAGTALAQPLDVAALPSYKPEKQLTGSIRILGSPLRDNIEPLLKAFLKYQPGLRYGANFVPNSEGAISGLYNGLADIAPAGDDAKITDMMPFFDTFGYLPTEISIASGGYGRGKLWPAAFVVHKDNPLTQITVDQIARVFGAERSGGWEGIETSSDHNFRYTTRFARSAASNIRTWGQLGVKGALANKPIQTYGYVAPGFKIYFERKLLHWSTKWNPNLFEFVEPIHAPGPEDAAVTAKGAMEAMSKDKYALGWVMPSQLADHPELKVLAVAAQEGGPYVPLNQDTVANRTYPLVRDAYVYINRKPGQPLNPIVREFLRFVLSREGQTLIASLGSYNPLPADVIAKQLAKIE